MVLTDEIQTLASFLEITIPDTGEKLGFTSIDRDVTINGVLFKANSSINPTATKSQLNLSTDNLEIKTLINNDDITPQLILSGYFDNAEVLLVLADWLEPPIQLDLGVVLLRGVVGEVTTDNTKFQFEIRSKSERLNQRLSRKASPKCFYDFGEPNTCKKDLIADGLKFENILITGQSGSDLTLDTTGITSDFLNGTLRFTNGVNAGILTEVRAVVSNNTVTISAELAGDIVVNSDTVTITAFCNKDQNACKNYNNFINFEGIPVGGNFMPGLARIAVVP